MSLSREQQREVNRLKNLELYRIALEERKKQNDLLQEKINNDLEQEKQERLKEREERLNRFRKISEDKRQRIHALQEKKLGLTLEEHKELIQKKHEEEQAKLNELENEKARILQEKRVKRKTEMKPKRRTRAPNKDTLGLKSVIEEKVQSWFNEFLEYADGKTGTEFLIYTKSEEGADEFEKLMRRYKRKISTISRKNEHIVQLRKKVFETYLINLV
jgi:hypothetical protein